MTTLSHTFIVEDQEQGMRLDKFLALKIQEASRSHLQKLIESGCVNVDHEICRDGSLKVRTAQKVEITLPSPKNPSPVPQSIPLDILFEDKDLMVIHKPAGMVVHPAPGSPDNTLVNALLSHCGESLSSLNGVHRPGIVHRLDKGTSGLLVVAKNDETHHNLAHQLASRKMKRVYQAFSWGMLLPPEGIIQKPIGRHPHHRQQMAIRSTGKPSQTHYKVLKFFGTLASLVECRLETGRTHQIRVHLASQGHPLIGDTLYGKLPKSCPPSLKTYLKNQWPQDRVALHAKELSFIHPTTHEPLHFLAELPEDMLNLMNVLNSFS